MRLQKWLALAGFGSRRNCEKIIVDGHVTVNGSVVTQLGTKLDPAIDKTAVYGKLVVPPSSFAYYILNKPSGVVTSLRDPKAGPTIANLISHIPYRVYPVGRLDKDAEGLLLITNDGELAYRLTHPRYKIWKSYIVAISGIPEPQELSVLKDGIQLEDGKTAPSQVRRIPMRVVELYVPKNTLERLLSMDKKERSWLILKIREGRKHQIKRMIGAIGYKVCYLRRISMGPLRLGVLPKGKVRVLTQNEVKRLHTAIGLIS